MRLRSTIALTVKEFRGFSLSAAHFWPFFPSQAWLHSFVAARIQAGEPLPVCIFLLFFPFSSISVFRNIRHLMQYFSTPVLRSYPASLFTPAAPSYKTYVLQRPRIPRISFVSYYSFHVSQKHFYPFSSLVSLLFCKIRRIRQHVRIVKRETYVLLYVVSRTEWDHIIM